MERTGFGISRVLTKANGWSVHDAAPRQPRLWSRPVVILSARFSRSLFGDLPNVHPWFPLFYHNDTMFLVLKIWKRTVDVISIWNTSLPVFGGSRTDPTVTANSSPWIEIYSAISIFGSPSQSKRGNPLSNPALLPVCECISRSSSVPNIFSDSRPQKFCRFPNSLN